jgi:hypothetical protein
MCCSLLGAVALACTQDDPYVVHDPGDSQPDVDTTPPAIEHQPVEDAQLYGQPVPLQATVTDEESGVFVVQVFYRQETSSMWEDVVLLDNDGDTVFEGQIPGSDVLTAGMHYYLSAMDGSENTGFDPLEGEDDPYHFRITPD